MEHNNRPQGRKKFVTNNSKGTARRGEGLNIGPVGPETRPGQQQQQQGMPGRRTVRSSGKRSPLIGIAALLVLLLGGGGGLMNSDLFSGDSNVSTNESYYSQQYQLLRL